MQLMRPKMGEVMDLREIYAKRLDREGTDPILTPDQWYPHFRDFHHRVIKETPDFDYGWLRANRLDLYQLIKTKEEELDALGEARLSQIMAIMREWRELVLKAEFERTKSSKTKAEGVD